MVRPYVILVYDLFPDLYTMWQLLLICALLGSGHARMVKKQSGDATPLPDTTQTCKYGAPSPNRGRCFLFHKALASVTAVADYTKILKSAFYTKST